MTSTAPLSFAQEGVWLADQLRPGEPTFTMPVAVRFRGPLDPAGLAGALDDVVARHEALRSVVRAPDGQALQYVLPSVAPALSRTDLTGLPAAERYPAAVAAARQEARRPLDPGTSMLRARLYRLDADDHLLFLAVHHIVWDGWSISVFYRDLSEFYRRRVHGRSRDLPALTVRYADYATEQRAGIDETRLSADLDYWRGELDAGLNALELPSARLTDPEDRAAGVVRHRVPAGAFAQLREFAKAERVSPFMLLTTALHAVLHRLTGTPSIATSFASANRNRAELENLVGLFVNQLVLRTDPGEDPTFRQLLRTVRRKALQAMEHADLPYERLLRELGLDLDPTRNTLGQVRLGYQNATDSSLLDLPGVDCEVVELHSGASRDKLDLVAAERPDGLDLVALYATGQTDELTVTRLLARLELVMAAGRADPSRPVSQLPLLVDGEAVELRGMSAGPAPAEPATVRDRVRAQIERTPDAVALVQGGESVTYRELGERARRLVHLLRRRGVRPGATVAVHLERSVDFVVTALALFDLGAHYLPLDPALPAARREFMLADAAPVLVVTADAHETFPCPVLALTPGWYRDVHAPAEPLGEPHPEDRAYVMYTSGSTGRPKGTTVPHRGVVNIAEHHQRLVPLAPGDRVLHSASLEFDLSVVQLYWPLAAGATVVIAPADTTADPRALAALAVEQRVTVISMVPSVIGAYLAADPPPVPGLRVVFAAGEALGAELVRRIHRYAPVPVINCYGPTEATVIALMWTVTPGERLPATIPIGRPVTGVRCHVLDDRLRPVPLGVTGELYLGGEGVTSGSGYLARPGLTAERYVPDPFGRPGGRLYRTGDLARVHADGAVYFLGRADRQLKVNGVRMEPGEIQAVLEEHPGVAETYVTVAGGRLVGYVVGADGGRPDEAELRAVAAAALPRQMVPSRFVHLERMPLTPNGKLDTAALPDPAAAPADPRVFVAPRGDTERVVARHIAAILDLDRVGATDDFFALGGTSLQAAQLAHELREELAVEVRLRDLFTASTVTALAAHLDGDRGERGEGEVSPLVPLAEGPAGPLQLVHPASGSVFHYADLAKFLDGGLELAAFQAVGFEEDVEPLTSISAMAEHYAAALPPDGPYLLGGWCIGGLVALEMAKLLSARGAAVTRLLLVDTHLPAAPEADFTDEELTYGFVEELAAIAGAGVPLSPAEAGALPLDELASALRSAGLLPGGTSAAALRQRIGVYSANVRAVTAYLRTPVGEPERVGFPVTVVRAEGSPSLLPAWRARVEDVADERTVPGDHYSMLREPALAEEIRELAR